MKKRKLRRVVANLTGQATNLADDLRRLNRDISLADVKKKPKPMPVGGAAEEWTPIEKASRLKLINGKEYLIKIAESHAPYVGTRYGGRWMLNGKETEPTWIAEINGVPES